MQLKEITDGAKEYFDDLKTNVETKNWSKVLVALLPIILTIVIIAVFKIKVWSPTAKVVKNYRRKYTNYRTTRRTRRTQRKR